MNAADYRGRLPATAMFNGEIDRRRLAPARFTAETAVADRRNRAVSAPTSARQPSPRWAD